MEDYTIRLTPPQLRGHAEEINNNADIVRREVQKIVSEVQTLRPTFLGASANKFLSDFDNARADMEQWDKLVKQFADLLTEAANKLEQADLQGGK